MAKIAYSVSGEGRGHATRVHTIVEALRRQHEVIIYAPRQAYDFLAPLYRETAVSVRRIPGLGFSYKPNRDLSYPRTGWDSMQFLAKMPACLRSLCDELEREVPDLIITDFEPLLPRAALRMDIPFLSINHQHILLVSDFRSLPPVLYGYVRFMAEFVRFFHRGQAETIVSSFYHPPLKPTWQHATQVGVLMRSEIKNTTPETGNHILVYLRRFASSAVLDALAASGCEVRIYGLGAQSRRGNMHFFEVDPHRFVEDLATSRALVSTAGNQLVGEALYLRKPVLAMPESGNYEQHINAHFLEQTGAGMTVSLDRVTPGDIRHLLDYREAFIGCIDQRYLHGNDVVLRRIQQHLPAPSIPQPVAHPAPFSEVAA